MAPRFLTLDFNESPATRWTRFTVLGIGVVALLASLVLLVGPWQARMEAQAQLASLQQRRPAHTAAPRTGSSDVAALRMAARVAGDLRAPWPELMRSMEASRSSDISLVQVEPVVARDSVRITADARHAEAMLDYLEQLRAQGLSEVTLTTHQIRVQEPGTPIRFQAQARWTGLEKRTAAAGAAPPEVSGPSTSPGSDLRALQVFIELARGAP